MWRRYALWGSDSYNAAVLQVVTNAAIVTEGMKVAYAVSSKHLHVQTVNPPLAEHGI